MSAVHQRCFQREQSIYRLEHYLPLLERKGRAVFQARPVRDNVPSYFLEWLEKQDLKPKALVGLLQKSLEFGYDAVMLGEYPECPTAKPARAIQDEIKVASVDLTAYDALCGMPKGVSA